MIVNFMCGMYSGLILIVIHYSAMLHTDTPKVVVHLLKVEWQGCATNACYPVTCMQLLTMKHDAPRIKLEPLLVLIFILVSRCSSSVGGKS